MSTLAILAAFLCDFDSVPGPGGLCLADARAFGHSPQEVRGHWRTAAGHTAVVRDAVAVNNSPEIVCAWEAECEWRRQVWDQLDTVLNCPAMGRDARLRSLVRVRELIGEAAWNSKQLPALTPSYRGLP